MVRNTPKWDDPRLSALFQRQLNGSSSGASKPTPGSPGSSINFGTLIGITFGCICAVVIMLVGGAIFLRRRHIRQRKCLRKKLILPSEEAGTSKSELPSVYLAEVDGLRELELAGVPRNELPGRSPPEMWAESCAEMPGRGDGESTTVPTNPSSLSLGFKRVVDERQASEEGSWKPSPLSERGGDEQPFASSSAR